jgi:trimeric autotransporter adhesin
MNFSRRSSTAVFGSLLIFALLYIQPSFSQLSAPRQMSENAIPASAQARISAVLGRDQRDYQAAVRRGGFQLRNPKQKLAAEFTDAGVRLQAGTGEWGLALRGYGYGDKLIVSSIVTPQASANRVEYRRGALTEWYVNGPMGLEQGFNITQSPGKRRGEPLTLAFNLSGDLTASPDPDGRGLTLKNSGAPTLRYGGLIARDTTGRELRAWMETSGERLWLRVDDAGAVPGSR